jgi:threonine/homoserine/homoserine lactone efflux protein
VLSCRAVALFLTGLTLGFSAAAQPGPFQAYLLAQSVRNGVRRTLPVGLVPLVSDPPLIAVVLAVLAQVPEGFLRVLQIAGGGVVLWLGVGALRAAFVPPRRAEAQPPPRGFVRAIAVNFTNPNAWIFWSLVGGPILAGAWRDAPARALVFLAGFYLFLVAGNAALVLLAGQASRLGPRFARGLGIASGVALLGFGLWQVGHGLAGA